ncbi:MAG: nucleoside kinase [Oscillospiraceae bacterium]|jgi:uridine kinase|nr:nucleoside kinase [Oscillospiraceae bacterium]
MSVIRNELEYINERARACPRELMEKSEARYQNIIAGIAERELRARGHKLVLLAGPSASGKTTTALKLAEAMGEAGVRAHRVSLDDFYHESGNIPLLPDGTPDIESVDALDLDLLRATLRDLLETGRGSVPHFQFKTGKRTRWDAMELGPDDMIVLEGLHALHPKLTQNLDPSHTIKIYISVSSRIYDKNKNIVLNKRSLRLIRRILRDSQFRGSGAAETIAMWPSVTAGEDQYLTPCKPFADLLVNTIHIYEPCVFAPLVLPLLEEIPADAPGGKEARRLARALRQFEPLPPDLVSRDSLLREFLGNF